MVGEGASGQSVRGKNGGKVQCRCGGGGIKCQVMSGAGCLQVNSTNSDVKSVKCCNWAVCLKGQYVTRKETLFLHHCPWYDAIHHVPGNLVMTSTINFHNLFDERKTLGYSEVVGNQVNYFSLLG